MQRENNKKTVAVSGGFDPLHIGHVRLFKEASKLGDHLVVILNNDSWLQNKKGYSFMPEKERAEVLEALEHVDEVFISMHEQNPEDTSVVKELREVDPDVFANGGDRKHDNIPEVPVCEEINCEMVFNVGEGGKVQSSSWLCQDFLKKVDNLDDLKK